MHAATGRRPADGMAEFAVLRGEVQAGLFAGLPRHVERLRWNAAQIRRFQRDRLRALLCHAIARSPFYARRLSGVDPARFELDQLPGLPVMTKADMMAEFDDVVTDRRLTRAAAEDSLAATGSEARALLGRYFCLATGGSSGRRGVFVSDVPAMDRVHQPAHAPGRRPHGRRRPGRRADEILHYPAADVHPLALRSVLVSGRGIADYQVRQTPAGIQVSVLPDAPADLAALRARLAGALADAGLPDPEVTVDVVAALPGNPVTGKLRRFIPA